MNSEFAKSISARVISTGVALAVLIGCGAALESESPSKNTDGGTISIDTLLRDHGHWMSAYSAASGLHTGANADEQSYRLVVAPSIGGVAVRIRLSNAYSALPLSVGAVRIAKAMDGLAIDPATESALTFSGQASVKIPGYADRMSDPLLFPVKYGEKLAVSVHVSGASGPMRGVPALGTACETVGASPAGMGDTTSDASGSAFLPAVGCVLLNGVDVYDPQALGTVVLLGDSITAGSSAEPNQGWAWKLAERINAAGLKMGAVNVAVSGNASTDQRDPITGIGPAGVNGTPVSPFGRPGVARFDIDVLRQTNVRTVIIYLAGNDLRYNAPVDEIIAANQDMVERAHAAGLRVLLATYTPGTKVNSACSILGLAGSLGGAGPVPCPADPTAIDRNDDRRLFNEWVRSHPTIDGFVDFDLAVRDPANPDQQRAEYDSGDNVHPNTAGHAAMANVVPLDLL